MKFAEKYEIVEMVTSGRVSTFLARERTTQEPLVVYTFECAGAGLSTASIVARFSSLAPSPPGNIVKAGFDEATSSAFITTKMPDSAALRAWVDAYHSFGKGAAIKPNPGILSSRLPDETAELNADELKLLLAKSAPARKPAQTPSVGGSTEAFSIGGSGSASPESAGEFTRLFRDVNAFQPVPNTESPGLKPGSATPLNFEQQLGSPLDGSRSDSVRAELPQSSPGDFTREFLGLSSENEGAPEPDESRRVPPSKETGLFTKEFLSASSNRTSAQSPLVPPASKPAERDSIFGRFGSAAREQEAGGAFDNNGGEKGETGEFTRAFRNPFDSPGVPEKEIALPEIASAAPPKEQTGDFTRMFGREESGAAPPSPAPEISPRTVPTEPSYTQIFGKDVAEKRSQLGSSTLGTNPNFRPTFSEPAVPPRLEPAKPSAEISQPADSFFSPAPSPLSTASDQTLFNRPVSSTTDVFRVRGGEAPPMEDVPSGPSEFTVFINRSQLKAVLPPEPAPDAPAAGGGAQTPSFAIAPVPQPGPLAPPVPPQAPPFAMPAVPPPPAFPRPPLPAVAPKAASIWPLITGLTILLAIAVILVMYFVLRH